jgi:hypothetical protein
MKPKEFKVKTLEDFQEMVNKKDLNIHKAVIKSILSNLTTRKKNIHMFSVKCADDNTILDITLEKKHFVSTLKENLEYFEKQEMYEECSQINEAITTLSKSK